MRLRFGTAAVVALAAFGAGPGALAQTVITTPPAAVDGLVLAPDEEVIVREYVVRRAPSSVRFEQDVTLRPGSVVPAYVELEPMAADSDPRLRRFAYFISPDAKIVVVNPVNREVVRILDR